MKAKAALVLVVAVCAVTILLSFRQTPNTCAHYATRHDAQMALALYPRLDRDRDGVACERKR